MPPENLPNRQGTSYTYSRQTIHHPGLVQMPGAGPINTDTGTPAPSVFVRIHTPYETEIVVWTAECEGGAPLVPSPVDPLEPVGLSANMILLGMTISGVVPVPKGGGAGHIWLMSGTYIYGKKRPDGPICDIKLGKMPYEKHGVGDNYFAKENFSMGIVDPAPVTPTAIVPTLRPRLGP